VGVETDWPERFSEGATLLLEAAPRRYQDVTIESASPHKGNMLVCLSGVSDRDGAEQLKGMYLLIRACDAAPLGEGEFWAHELEGMLVVDEDGRPLGEVEEVLCRPAQDLLVIRGEGGEEHQVPFGKGGRQGQGGGQADGTAHAGPSDDGRLAPRRRCPLIGAEQVAAAR